MKISESIEFMTQIHKAWDGTEQRMGLRPKPRRYFSYDYIGAKSADSQYLRALSYSQQTELLKIPLWHGASKPINPIFKGDMSLTLPTNRLWHYRDAGSISLWLSDIYGGDYFQLRTAASDGTLGFSKKVTSDWAVGKTTCVPVAWCVLQQEDKFMQIHSALTSMQLHYEMVVDQEAPTFPPAMDEYHDEPVQQLWGRGIPVQYKGLEVFMTPPAWTADITSNFSRNAVRLDNKTGIFKYDLKSPDPTEGREIEYVPMSREAINNMQRFFCRCKGKLKAFWAPTWLNDIELAVDAKAGDSILITKWPLYFKYFTSGSRRKTIAVFDKDFSGRVLAVAGYAIDNKTRLGKIYLDSPLKKDMRINSTLMISFFCKYRFDTDVMTTDYETPEVATISLPFAEVTQ
jgi:hypothetical protein